MIFFLVKFIVDFIDPLLLLCKSIKEQTTSLRIASTCSGAELPATFGEMEGHKVAACIIPIKRKFIKNAFKILRTNFMTLLYYNCEKNK